MAAPRMLIALLVSAGAGLIAGSAGADPHQVQVKGITISERVVRASIGNAPNSAAYMIIFNANGTPDRLLSAACACAARVEAHETHPMAGMPSMMEMSATGPVVIPAHGSVAFRPGGMHLMLTGLKERLADGGSQDITLVFEHAGRITADFHIRSQIAADGAPPIRPRP
jgi:copper(I)-binding protein